MIIISGKKKMTTEYIFISVWTASHRNDRNKIEKCDFKIIDIFRLINEVNLKDVFFLFLSNCMNYLLIIILVSSE